MIFDIIYIMACDFYRRREKDSFTMSGVVLFAAAILMNLMFGAIIYYHFWADHNKAFIDQFEWIAIGIYLFVFLPMLALRYFKFTSYEEINNKIYRLPQGPRMLYQMFGVSYLILSFATTLGSCIYLGGMVNGWW